MIFALTLPVMYFAVVDLVAALQKVEMDEIKASIERFGRRFVDHTTV